MLRVAEDFPDRPLFDDPPVVTDLVAPPLEPPQAANDPVPGAHVSRPLPLKPAQETLVSGSRLSVLDVQDLHMRRGALGALLGVSGEKLESIDFDAGSAKLLPPEREKIKQVAQILAKRAQLKLSVPGQYSEAADGLVARTAASLQDRASRSPKEYLGVLNTAPRGELLEPGPGTTQLDGAPGIWRFPKDKWREPVAKAGTALGMIPGIAAFRGVERRFQRLGGCG